MTLDLRSVRPTHPAQAVQVTTGNAHDVAAWVRELPGGHGAVAYDGMPAVWLQQDNRHRQTLAEPGDWVVSTAHGPVVVAAADYPDQYAEDEP